MRWCRRSGDLLHRRVGGFGRETLDALRPGPAVEAAVFLDDHLSASEIDGIPARRPEEADPGARSGPAMRPAVPDPVRTGRWEVGSAFPLPPLSVPGQLRTGWLPRDVVLHGTGRQAFRALLQHGRDVHDWRRVLIPSYSCPDVGSALRDVLPIARYPCSPGTRTAPPEPGPNEVVLVTSLFGIQPGNPSPLSGANIILDVTHDPLAPWLDDVDAGYVVASLRKTLPVPDGAATWSPRSLSLPRDPPPVARHIEAVAAGVRAMYLKSEYLGGADVGKDTYLRLFASMEQEFAHCEPARISAFSRDLIRSLPVHEWRRQRLRNIDCLTEALGAVHRLAVLPSTFGVIALFESRHQRDKARLWLLRARIYPAILWPMESADAGHADRDFSQRMLFLHADFRWTEHDMHRVAEQVAASLDAQGGNRVGLLER